MNICEHETSQETCKLRQRGNGLGKGEPIREIFLVIFPRRPTNDGWLVTWSDLCDGGRESSGLCSYMQGPHVEKTSRFTNFCRSSFLSRSPRGGIHFS